MNEHLVKFWLFATHWTELDTFDTEEELNDEIELLHRQNLPTKVRQRTRKDGGEELVLYVKQADRDYARYCTGWRASCLALAAAPSWASRWARATGKRPTAISASSSGRA